MLFEGLRLLPSVRFGGQRHETDRRADTRVSTDMGQRQLLPFTTAFVQEPAMFTASVMAPWEQAVIGTPLPTLMPPPLMADTFHRMARDVQASIDASNRLFATLHQQVQQAMATPGGQVSSFQQVQEFNWTPAGGQFRSVTTENGKTVSTQGVFHPGLVTTKQGPFRVAYTANPDGIDLQWRHHTEGTGGTQRLLTSGGWAATFHGAVPPVALPNAKATQDPHQWLLFYNAQDGQGEPSGVGVALLNRDDAAAKDHAPITVGGHLPKAVGPKTLRSISQACLTEDDKFVVLMPTPQGPDVPKPVTLELASLIGDLQTGKAKRHA